MPKHSWSPLKDLSGMIAGSTASAYATAGDITGDAHEPMSGGHPSAVCDVAAQDLANNTAL